MPSLNRVELIGHLGREPEMRYTQGGKAVTSVSLAVSGPNDTVEWVNLVAWEKTGETLNQLGSKGKLLYVEGRLQTRTWDGPDGAKHYRTEVVVGRWQMLEKRPADTRPDPDPIPSDDDLTF